MTMNANGDTRQRSQPPQAPVEPDDRKTYTTGAARQDMLTLLTVGFPFPVKLTASPEIAPALAGTWVNFAGGQQTAGYYKTPDGRVWLRGLVTNATAQAAISVIFILPAGYRPTATEIFLVSGGGAATEVRIDTAGNVYLQLASAANVYISLAGISFDPR